MERIVRLTSDIRARIANEFPRARVLDIGCGMGEFLGALTGTKFERVGLEPNPYAAQWVREHLGIEVVEGLYGTGRFAPASFDVIVATQVLEHVADPREFLSAAFQHLRPRGMLVIDVPSYNNPRFLAYRLTGYRRVVQTEFIASHLFYYTRPTLAQLVREAGFRVERITAGRYRQKSGWNGWLMTVIDAAADTLGVGGLVCYARRPAVPYSPG
jgi:2-polyprenyl-3-methyl-5-hydroxy-6-metoxy-1,4-benzoquinol methylase